MCVFLGVVVGVFSVPSAVVICGVCVSGFTEIYLCARKAFRIFICVYLRASLAWYFVLVCVYVPLRLPSQECILYPIQYLFRAPHISGPIDTSDSLQDNNRSSLPPPLYGYHYYHPPRGNAQNREGGQRFHPSSIPLSVHPDPLSFYYFALTRGVRDGGMLENEWMEGY